MACHITRTQSWLADLAAINAEIEAGGFPVLRRPERKRARKLKPLWEE